MYTYRHNHRYVIVSEENLYNINTIIFSHTSYELPLQITANQFPDLILDIEFVAILEQRKGRQILIQIQQFTKFVQDIRIRQEVAAIFGTVFLERRLYFLEHVSQLLLNFATHNWGGAPV